MAFSFASVSLLGIVGKKEIKTIATGDRVATVSVAVSESKKDKQGQWQTETMWLDVSIWNKHLVDALDKINKGDKVFVEGDLKCRTWEQDGVTKTKYFVQISYQGRLILAESKADKQARKNETADVPQDVTTKVAYSSDDDLDDSVPF